jgi:hypothetical protein
MTLRFAGSDSSPAAAPERTALPNLYLPACLKEVPHINIEYEIQHPVRSVQLIAIPCVIGSGCNYGCRQQWVNYGHFYGCRLRLVNVEAAAALGTLQHSMHSTDSVS